MIRKTFKDMYGKPGKIGTVVLDPYWGERTIKEIISKGRGGTRLYYFEGGFCPSKHVAIVEDSGDKSETKEGDE